jgi:hypothetical protein
MNKNNISIFYIARGKDQNSISLFKDFAKSYTAHPPGINHNLYIIFKGFYNPEHIKRAKSCFKNLHYKSLYFADDSFDIGAYLEAAKKIDSKYICCLKTSSIILADNWLLKLYVNLSDSTVGLVGATGSFESLSQYNYKNFPAFPNAHIRSSAFMIKSKYLLKFFSNFKVKSKDDAWLFESGQFSLSNMIYADGKECLIVGKNGRGYSSSFWKISGTYRFGYQENLLIGDNVTNFYMKEPSSSKRALSFNTWQ